jgi:hypothetical protein
MAGVVRPGRQAYGQLVALVHGIDHARKVYYVRVVHLDLRRVVSCSNLIALNRPKESQRKAEPLRLRIGIERIRPGHPVFTHPASV